MHKFPVLLVVLAVLLISPLAATASSHGGGGKAKGAEVTPAMLDQGKAVYEKNCAACHATGVAGAPKFGDKAAWKKHIAAGLEHMKRFGTKLETFAKIRAKASRHASNNPLALFKKVVTEEEVMASPVLWPGVMTRLMACPPTCGAAAAIVTSGDFAKRHSLRSDVKIAAQAITTDSASTFDNNDLRGVAGYYMAQTAARKVYEAAGIGPEDIDVIELHDCFAQNELLTYEALGLCAEGEAEKLVLDGDNTYGGKYVTNPSGGLLSKGHPIGATGLAQCFELVNQLRGEAEARQVPNARLALQHNIGIGGACVVTLYERV